MTDRFRLTISQLNPTLGNFKENFSKAVTSWEISKAEKANLVALFKARSFAKEIEEIASKPIIKANHLTYSSLVG